MYYHNKEAFFLTFYVVGSLYKNASSVLVPDILTLLSVSPPPPCYPSSLHVKHMAILPKVHVVRYRREILVTQETRTLCRSADIYIYIYLDLYTKTDVSRLHRTRTRTKFFSSSFFSPVFARRQRFVNAGCLLFCYTHILFSFLFLREDSVLFTPGVCCFYAHTENSVFRGVIWDWTTTERLLCETESAQAHSLSLHRQLYKHRRRRRDMDRYDIRYTQSSFHGAEFLFTPLALQTTVQS